MIQILQRIKVHVVSFALSFVLIIFIPSVGLSINAKFTYEDSVYRSFSKTDRIKKLLLQPILDFDNKLYLDSIDQLLDQHQLGGIIIGNGSIEEVSEWINNVKNTHQRPPLFILEMRKLLDFSFRGSPKFPQQNQLELLSQDSLTTELGRAVGELALLMGFDMILLNPAEVDSTLQFESSAYSWVRHYLNGISESGLSVVLDNIQAHSLLQIPEKIYQSDGFVLSNGIEVVKKSERNKSRKASFQKELTFKRAEYAQNLNRLFDIGNQVVILPTAVNQSLGIIDYCTSEKILNNKRLKQKFKKVIKFQREITSIRKPLRTLDQIARKVEELNFRILSGSVVCMKNEDEILPFKDLEKVHFASISASSEYTEIFRDHLDKYARVAHYDFDYILKDQQSALKILSHFDNVIVNIDDENEDQHRVLKFLEQLSLKSKIVITYSGDQRNLSFWIAFDALVWVPQNSKEYTKLLPQKIFGALTTNGFFPFESVGSYKYEKPIVVEKSNRISYAFPELVEVNLKYLKQIDVIAEQAITDQTMPGCQIMMIKNGTVVYEKSFGHITYDSLQKVGSESIYDIASVTKVVATVPTIMYLEEQKKLKPDDSIGEYLTVFRETNKANITIQNLLRHQSGLKSHMPFWKKAQVKANGDFSYKIPHRKRRFYNRKAISINWNDSISSWIASSDYNSLREDSSTFGYLYSDLGYIVLKDIAESQLNMPLDTFLTQNIYKPLGMTSTTYYPLCQFPKDEIVPTERDNYFRKKLIRGEVNDQNAAIAEGADGHAGLFGTATDLGKFLQMYLQGGSYGGKKYFNKETIEKYTTKLDDSKRRALGWDKPDHEVENASKYASESSFGHTGFTGTMIWVDPKHDMIYVFLSNRTYPDAKNNKLSENNIRTKIHDIMYESFLNAKFE